ncbi:MAG: hypothetical protein KDA83_20785 [Planctomycetales bacterium]|nr:hypothetical protein [Planctomycetales bacterium]
MAIRVTCPGCKTRFNVGDQFAGKTGPCPKCKASIKIPDKSEEVVVHGPDAFGPKDSKGRAVSKPIFREETKVTPVQLTMLIGAVLLAIGGALAVRFIGKPLPVPLLMVVAAVLAPPLSWAGYAFLRNQELASYRGTELWARVGITSLLFVALWGLFPVIAYALNADGFTMVVAGSALLGMLFAGGAITMVAYDLDYMLGCVHFGLYLIVCLVLRFIANLSFLPLDQG